MEQKAVKVNSKIFAIVYTVNGHSTIAYKLRSTNGKQALQTFIRHHWNGLEYTFDCLPFYVYLDAEETQRVKWYAGKKGFATLVAVELLK